uniref:hypothetical protein n=1 Tax=Trichocoleus desertorum TaxID=1481672 RepID=UPI0025B2A9EF|nr:hypothetical protein [Trichocoleus desertorum]
MIAQVLTTQAVAQQELNAYLQKQADTIAPESGEEDERGSGRVSDRDFWARLDWEKFCFPERYPNLVEQHRAAGLDPADEKHLSAEPWGRQRPTQARAGKRTVSID